MTQEFIESTIEEICNVEYGTRVVRKKDAGTIYPVYGGGGETFFLNSFNRENRVVIARFAMSEKCTRRVLGKFALNDSGLTLSPKNTSVLRQDYLDYFVLSINDLIYESARGTAQKNLDVPAFRQMKVVYPSSLEKQLDIVEKLDSAFREFEESNIKTSLSLEYLRTLLDSKFEEVFKLIEDKYGMIQSGTAIDVRDGTHDSPSYVDSGYPLITSKNLQDGLIDFSKVSFIKQEDYQQINKRSKVEAGDLLFAMIGTIGNPVVVKEEPFFAIKNVALFKGNPKYDMNFLSFYLRSPKIKEKFNREAKGTTQRFLGLGYLRTFEIPNVPIDDQLEIVIKLEQFETELKRLELNLKQRLKSLIELNKSILSSFFTSYSDEEAVA